MLDHQPAQLTLCPLIPFNESCLFMWRSAYSDRRSGTVEVRPVTSRHIDLTIILKFFTLIIQGRALGGEGSAVSKYSAIIDRLTFTLTDGDFNTKSCKHPASKSTERFPNLVLFVCVCFFFFLTFSALSLKQKQSRRDFISPAVVGLNKHSQRLTLDFTLTTTPRILHHV